MYPRLTLVPASVKVQHSVGRWQIVDKVLKLVIDELYIAIGCRVAELLEIASDLGRA